MAMTGASGPAPSVSVPVDPMPSSAPSGSTPVVVDPVPEPSLVTSGEGAYWMEGTLTEGGTTATVTIDETKTKGGAWQGWGGTFNEKGWDAMSHLSEADRARAIELLFSMGDGARFTWGRVPVGASDYAVSRYTLEETQGEFSIARDKMQLIPYIRAAQAVNPNIKFWGSPWTPPKWMKSNNDYDKGDMLDAHLGDHAAYLVNFIKAYHGEGIDMFAIFPQNESGWSQGYPSCYWTDAQMITYIKTHLGPALATLKETDGLDTQLWLGTLSNNDTTVGSSFPTSAANQTHKTRLDYEMGKAVMADADAKAFVKGIGMQWGLDSNISDFTGFGVPVWQTEHKCGNYPWGPADYPPYNAEKAPNDHAYGVESWGLLKKWITGGVSAYFAWNMVLDTKGASLDTARPWNQNALLTVDTTAGTLNITPAYYVFRHLSQFVDVGATRIDVEGDLLAFKNPDGSLVAVIHNAGAAAPMTVSIGGRMFQFQAPANGWATVNYKP
jgi:glucosylceramidase